MKKVIVQDTDHDLLETITLILEEGKYDVLPIVHYDDVIPQIRNFRPQMVLLDFKLYGEDSIGICRLIKKDFPLLPVIAMSCNLNIQNEYNKAGFDDFIAKPFDIDYLFVMMQKYLNT